MTRILVAQEPTILLAQGVGMSRYDMAAFLFQGARMEFSLALGLSMVRTIRTWGLIGVSRYLSEGFDMSQSLDLMPV